MAAPPPGRFPAFVVATLFAAGICVGHAVGAHQCDVAVLLLAGLTGVLGFFLFTRSARYGAVAAGVVFLAGVVRVQTDLRTDGLERIRPDQPSRAMLRLVDLPDVRPGRVRCLARLEQVLQDSVVWVGDETILLTVLRARGEHELPGLAYGMRLVVRGSVGLPSPARNPGEMSPRDYFAACGINTLVDVRGGTNVMILGSDGGSVLFRSLLFPVRAFILREIDRTIGGEEGEFLKGLLIGERSGLQPATRVAFVDAGVAHVLAVSGSNVALVAGVVFLVLELLRVGRLARVLASSVAILFYMVLTGSQPPVVRASIMALVFLTGRFLGERTNPYNIVGVAAILILARDGRQLFDVGFQLSFLAVLSLVHGIPFVVSLSRAIGGPGLFRRFGRAVATTAGMSLAATLGTLPVTAVCFGRVSVIGIVANAIVVPATGISVVLGTLSTLAAAFSTFLGSVYAAVNAIILRWTLGVTLWSAGVPFAVIDTQQFTGVHALPYYAMLGLLLHARSIPLRRFFVLMLLAGVNLLVYLPVPPELAVRPGVLRMTVLDVGQGDAILLEFADSPPMLVDAGPASPGYDAGGRVIVPFLRRKGINDVGILLLTHGHADHVGGLQAVLGGLRIRQVVVARESALWTDGPMKTSLHGVTIQPVAAGEILVRSASTRVYVLGPPAAATGQEAGGDAGGNNASVAVKVVFGSTSLLLVGDAEHPAEEEMLFRYGDFLHSTVLKVGHHGGGTSTSPEFLAAIRPWLACISVGVANRHGHPASRVLEHLDDAGAEIARTDQDGAIVLESDGHSVRRVLWR